jgi:hypothetical protein
VQRNRKGNAECEGITKGMRRDCAAIARRLRIDYVSMAYRSAYRLRIDCAAIRHRFYIDCASISHRLRIDFTSIAHRLRIDCASIAHRFQRRLNSHTEFCLPYRPLIPSSVEPATKKPSGALLVCVVGKIDGGVMRWWIKVKSKD